jgi:DNA replication and repair protein RecF
VTQVIVEHLSLVDFRNYATAELRLFAGPNVLVGRNGQGKTNLAEAIVYLATLSSHRVSSDAPLIREGQDFAVVRARLVHGERAIQLELQLNRQGANQARINGSPVKTAELPRYAHVVLFAPEDLQIVRGDPSSRRRFMDQLLIQRLPRMAGVLADYERVLKQRTTLLKSGRARGLSGDGLVTLDIWDEKMIALGSEIIQARSRLAQELKDPLRDAYATIAGADHNPEIDWVLSIDGYDPDEENSVASADFAPVNVAEYFRRALVAKRSKELDRGLTLVGPHRDDLLLKIKGLPVKGFASHGESWTTALALRIASAELLRTDSISGDPVIILDDVFAELDSDRRARLSELVSEYEQVIVTAAVEEDIPEALHRHVVRIHAGEITDERGEDA